MKPLSSEKCLACGYTFKVPPTHHLMQGTVLNNRYLIGNAIGEGGFGITYIGRDLNLDMIVAVKEFYPKGFVNRNNLATFFPRLRRVFRLHHIILIFSRFMALTTASKLHRDYFNMQI